MDQIWAAASEKDTGILVPTQSLASSLRQSIADYHVAQGREVWESPNIFTWRDLLQIYWQKNNHHFEGAYLYLDNFQTQLLWTKVVQRSRRENEKLTLLNVAQTVRTVQKSWQMMTEWQLDSEALATIQDADSQQFQTWCADYQKELQAKNALDQQLLFSQLLSLAQEKNNKKVKSPIKKLIWYSFDLYNGAHIKWKKIWAARGVEQVNISQKSYELSKPEVLQYQHQHEELAAAFKKSRVFLEQNSASTVQVIVPNLQQIQKRVEVIAANEFYPCLSPLELQNTDLIYRFTLGRALADWPAITVAINLLGLLRGRLSVTQLRSLFRNPYLSKCRSLKKDLTLLESELLRQRRSHINLAQLLELTEQTQPQAQNLLDVLRQANVFAEQLDVDLGGEKETTNKTYRTLSFARWRSVLQDWLQIWGWHTTVMGQVQTSVEYQLQKSWEKALASLEGLALVQESVGFTRIIELIKLRVHDQVFLPEAANSPIIISGVLEALGHSAGLSIVTGMDETYPASAKPDPFLGQLLQLSDVYPSATPQRHMLQVKHVVQRLITASKQTIVSHSLYTDADQGAAYSISPIFRQASYSQRLVLDTLPYAVEQDISQPMEYFKDNKGPPISANRPVTMRGGTRVFVDQSQCAFKAFAVHRLGCRTEEDSEFGLDHLDRGIIVHKLLENCWYKLDNSQALSEHIDAQTLGTFVGDVVSDTILTYRTELNEEKFELLKLETKRLENLLINWLEFEANRPEEFAVIGLEEAGKHDVGGISFSYKIDRVDMLPDGRTLIMDYKTGSVNRNDWHGERIREPQLPLYSLAKKAQKNRAPSGITYAHIQQFKPKFEELSEAGIVRKSTVAMVKREEQWNEALASWPQKLQRLGEEFLAGQAAVDPIDEKVCEYCELKPLCRIYQQEKTVQLIGKRHD